MSERIRVCGNPEPVNGSIARWDNTSWTGAEWAGTPRAVALTISGPDWAKPSILWACGQVEAACAVVLRWVDTPSRASILVKQGRIDGPSGTLAWMQLPYGPDKQLDGKLDTSEAWHTDPLTSPARGKIHLGAVILHELLHGLGVEHIPTSRGRALLNPMYGPDLLKLAPLDVAELVLRYGPPVIDSPADPVTPDGPTIVFEIAEPGRYALVKQ